MFTIMDFTGYMIAIVVALIVYAAVWELVMPLWCRIMNKHIKSYIEILKEIEGI